MTSKKNHKKPTVLIISQTYPPDPAALGQHMHDAALELVDRGYRVVTYTASRGYDDPTEKFPLRENLQGVDIRRLILSSFGKASIAVRLIGGVVFCLQAMVRGLFTRNLTLILISTSPPMAPMAALFIRFFRRRPMLFWGMDINPDQMIAMGKISEKSISARIFNALISSTLKHSDSVVTLDRFMGQTLDRKHPIDDKLSIDPPWPHDDHIQPVAHADNPFRKEHDLEGKTVFMYSGNMSPSHPMDAMLEAARRVQDDPKIHFMFIGGGQSKASVEAYKAEHQLDNLTILPFQPFETLKYSLSAADVHLVSMGDNMVGIVHPCKIYGSMAAGRPLLLTGPALSHVGEIIDRFDIGWQLEHDDADGVERLYREIAAMPKSDLEAIGRRALEAQQADMSLKTLCDRFCDTLESVVWRRPDGISGAKSESKSKTGPQPESAPGSAT